jgi:preprotein translocase subunit SecG
MQTQWQKILVKITFWLIVEIILNLFGLDNLADYSEFVFEGNTVTAKSFSQLQIES